MSRKKLPLDTLLRRAGLVAAHAVEQIAQGDAVDLSVPGAEEARAARFQNAAGKAWVAARMSAQAVLDCKTGRRPSGTEALRDALRDLAAESRNAAIIKLNEGFRDAFEDLHLRCGDDGICAADGVKRRVRTVVDEVVPTAKRLCAR